MCRTITTASRETRVFQEQALYNTRGVTIGQEGNPQRMTAMLGTPSLLRLLQVRPLRGRIFTEEDGEVGNDPQGGADVRDLAAALRGAATTPSGATFGSTASLTPSSASCRRVQLPATLT